MDPPKGLTGGNRYLPALLGDFVQISLGNDKRILPSDPII